MTHSILTRNPGLVLTFFLLTLLLPGNAKCQDKEISHSSNIKYINITNLSYGVGIGKGYNGSRGFTSIGIHSINGCLLPSNFSIGIGVGIDKLQIGPNLSQTTIPISVDLRYFFLKEPKILFIDTEGGYAFNLKGTDLGPNRGGFFIDPSIGIKPVSFKKISVSASIGIKIQHNTIEYVWRIMPKNETFLNFKTGIIF